MHIREASHLKRLVYDLIKVWIEKVFTKPTINYSFAIRSSVLGAPLAEWKEIPSLIDITFSVLFVPKRIPELES